MHDPTGTEVGPACTPARSPARHCLQFAAQRRRLGPCDPPSPASWHLEATVHAHVSFLDFDPI